MSFPGDRVRSTPELGPNKEKALSTDWYTKLVLTVIAASAAFLVAEHLNADDGGSDGRYRLQAIPMGRILLRLDTVTGQTWSTALNKPKAWTEIADSPIDTLDDPAAPEAAAADAAPPAPKPAPKLQLKKPEAPAEGDS